MPETSYWYLATAPLSVPYWTEVTMCEAEFGNEIVVAPMLFTTRGGAEAEMRKFVEGEADAYLRAVDGHGTELINEALDNSPAQRVYEIDSWLLSEHLKDSAVMYVTVDGQVRLAWELAEDLQGA